MTDDAALPTPGPAQRPGRLALWGARAARVVAVGAVAVVAGRDGGGGDQIGARRLPIALGSSAGGTATAEGRAAGPATDMAMLAYVHYSAGEDLPALGGDGAAYRLRGGVDVGALRAVARALGLQGEPARDPDQKDSWTVRDGDALLTASEHGGSWWYSSDSPAMDRGAGSSSGSSGSSGAVDPSCPPDAKCIDPVPVTTTTVFVPPADLPSEAEARRIAVELFERTGADLAGADITAEGPYESWFVSAYPKVAGLPVSGYGYTASVGPKGVILDAAGVLSRPEDLGPYPTLGTRQAIERLNAGMSFGYGLGGGREQAVDDLAVSSSAAPVAPSEPIEVVLHGAERILVLVSAADDSGDTYLVPGYRMTGDDGQVAEVPAIDDEAMLPTPTTTPAPASAGGAAPTGQ
jgi:hypothetical protein